jgi:8-oxo-dGTP diphosphatase
MEPEIKHFNLRVYALIIDEQGRVLLSDEFQRGMRMTKFPGGGLHLGEGTLECLHREALEEFGQDLEVIRHYYTTDFFQKALFYADHQLISIYYLCRFTHPIGFKISEKPFDFKKEVNDSISFRWCSIAGMDPEANLSFPVDVQVGKLLVEDRELKC